MTEQITTDEKTGKKRRFNWAGLGFFISTFAVVVFFAAFGYGYFQLAKINVALAKSISEVQNDTSANKTELADLQKSIEALQQNTQQSQALTNQQAQLIAAWQAAQKGDLEKWYVAEAAYLVKLANDHLQFSSDTQMALNLLESADQVLQKAQNSKVLELRKAVATDIASLQAVPVVDITALYLRLAALNNLLDQLPLPSHPLIADTAPASTEQPAASLPWWKAGLAQSWQALRKIVIVRNTASTALPLILPEEKIFLYQNLHAQCEAAMWAVLHRNNAIFQNNLARMQDWIKLYFEQNANETKSMLDNVEALQKINIQASAINLDATSQAFDQYLAQTSAAS